jgi:arylsulfatase B
MDKMRKRTLRLCFCAALLTLTPGWLRPAAAAATRPNIVIFLADDLGWNDVGYHGSEIKTPRLDELARQGVVLDQFYVYPTCSPTRAALLSGRNPSRLGILAPLYLDPKDSLPLETVTLAELLAGAGYATGFFGKWHLGPTFDYGPRKQGFQEAYGSLHSGADPFKRRWRLGQTWFRDDEFIDEPGHATDLLAREAVAFIRRHRERPFFLYLPFNAPHVPLGEEEKWIKPYEGSIQNEDRRLFAATVTHLDEAVGRVLDALDEEKVRDRTLVIFLSDNGGEPPLPAGSFGGYYKNYSQKGDNRPLRGWKSEVYEGGIRVPALAHWPGRLAPRKVTAVTSVNDILPTAAKLAGVALRPGMRVEGMDIWPLLTGQRKGRPRTLYWETPQQSALRAGDWKLVETRRSGKVELFDLRADPYEKSDLAAEQPGRVQRMRRLLADLRGAPPRRGGAR